MLSGTVRESKSDGEIEFKNWVLGKSPQFLRRFSFVAANVSDNSSTRSSDSIDDIAVPYFYMKITSVSGAMPMLHLINHIKLWPYTDGKNPAARYYVSSEYFDHNQVEDILTGLSLKSNKLVDAAPMLKVVLTMIPKGVTLGEIEGPWLVPNSNLYNNQGEQYLLVVPDKLTDAQSILHNYKIKYENASLPLQPNTVSSQQLKPRG